MDLTLIFALSLAFLCIGSTFGEDEDEKVVSEILVPPPADCERKSKNGDKLFMQYTGTLTETGEKFDSSYDRDQPFDFQLGSGRVIKGWEEGLLDMCVGEKRKLIIPSSKGYGKQGSRSGKIPPNASLTFEVELVEIQDATPPPNVFKLIDENQDEVLSQDEVSDYLRKQAANFAEEGTPSDDQHNELVTNIFTHEDKDKDGFISHEEFSGPKHDEL